MCNRSNLISVIIPLYNNGKYLSKCLESVINQPYKNIEIIIIDDGSTDNGLEIAQQYSQSHDNINVFHFENGGVSVARNRGIERATGKYLAFLDPDDTWIENCLTEKLIFELEKDYDIVYCGGCYSDGQNIIGYLKLDEGVVLSGGFEAMNKVNELFAFGFYSHKLITEYDLSFEKGRKYQEDTVFMKLALYCSDKTLYIDNPIYNYWKTNSQSVTHNKNNSTERINEVCLALKHLSEQAVSKKSFGEENDAKLQNYINMLIQGAALEILQCRFAWSTSVKEALNDLRRLDLYDFVINGDKSHLSPSVQRKFMFFKFCPHLFMLYYRTKAFLRITAKKLLPKSLLNIGLRKFYNVKQR